MNDNNTSELSGINKEISVEEGKYPERQAYNSDGWLVTFSSKEDRDLAIKKRTHSISDPTHGKGGMKMYSKKKEKQQLVQSPRVSDKNPAVVQPPTQQQMNSEKSIQKPEQPDETEEYDDDYYSYEMQAKDDAYMVQKLGNRYKSKYIKQPGQDEMPQTPSPDTATSVQQTPEYQPTVVPTPPPVIDYVSPSKKFAEDKGWTQTPYGDWRDEKGTTVAITAASGEVVPINNAYRDELKMLSKKNTKMVEEIISDAALDTRISDGMVNLKNSEHIQVIAEVMYNRDIDVDTINEFVEKFMDEGKYPERQAYNKDGWLVTFPSAEYKQKAIKKGTHYGSDPTHGKGGMNLYYKKRGKQKRQTQQAVSSTDPTQQFAASPKQTYGTPEQKPTTAAPTSVGDSDASSRTSGVAKISGATNKQSTDASTTQVGASVDTKTAGRSGTETPDSNATGQSSLEPTIATQPSPVATPVSNYVFISVKFATDKGWTKTPYGEWRDSTGNTAAVIALSGEAVPVKSVERDELKLIADKNKI